MWLLTEVSGGYQLRDNVDVDYESTANDACECLCYYLIVTMLVGSVVKSRRLCYFVESTSICLKFYFVEK